MLLERHDGRGSRAVIAPSTRARTPVDDVLVRVHSDAPAAAPAARTTTDRPDPRVPGTAATPVASADLPVVVPRG